MKRTFDGWSNLAVVLAVTCVICGIALRIIEIDSTPLWIDETFTAAIAGQTNFERFAQFARDDAPTSFLYYLIIHFWQMVFGLSDVSLRMPSLIFSIMSVVLAALWRMPGMTAMERITWVALLASWPPGIGIADDARCYSLLSLIATGEIILFAKLLDDTSLRNVGLWVVAAALMIAANFDAAYLTLIQGIVFWGLKGRVVFRTWPAAFLALPVVIELVWKWPILTEFEKVGSAWYPLLTGIGLLQTFVYILGGFGANGIVWLLYLPAFWLFLWITGLLRPYTDSHGRSAPRWVAAASVLGVIAIVAVGYLRPSFTWRYLISFEPGLLLGVVLVTGKLARSAEVTGQIGILIIALCATFSWWCVGAPHMDSVVPSLNIECAANELMDRRVKSVVFTWDNPTADIMPVALLSAAASFFFSRAHYPAAVTAIRLDPKLNGNQTLLAAAAPKDAAIIWLYDRTIIASAAKKFPPDISDLDRLYSCDDFGNGSVGSLACFEKPIRPMLSSGSQPNR